MTSELNKDMIILDWILNAKKCYINDLSRVGMCKAFKRAFQYVQKVNRNLAKLITDLGWEIEYLYDEPIYNGKWLSKLILKVVKLVSELRGLDLLCERCKPWIFNLPEVGWGDFWVIPMTVEGFMGTLYYGTYSKDEVREIYESKGIGLI